MKSMLKWISILLFTALAAAQTTAPSPATAAPATAASAQNNWLPPLTGNEDATVKKARTLLTQMIEAMGGAAYMDLNSVEQIGLTYSFYNGRPNSLGTDFRRVIKYPDKERVELTKQRDVVYIANGKTGWEVTYKGTTLQDPKTWRDYSRRRNFSLEYMLRVWLKQPSTQIYYEGTAISEQRMADVVSLMNGRNESATIYIDQTSHLPIKNTYSYRDPYDKQKDQEGEIYGNWRMEGTINTPHSIVRTHNGDYASQRFIKSVTYNVATPDSLFTAKPTYDPYVLERRLDQEKIPEP
ncbi:MAG TPA: hypothetical protein VGL89_14830 [Candidatus Koribacter sp.]